MEILKQVATWLAVQLDKLKSKVLLFLLIQAVLSALALGFANDIINVPTPQFLLSILNAFGIPDLDTVFAVILGGIVALSGPRTSQLKAEFLKEKSNGK